MEIIRVKDIVSHLHKIANPLLAEIWDNVGLQIGSPEWTVKRILLTLDVTETAITLAKSIEANLIISHHPKIFKPIKSVTDPVVIELISEKIAVLSLHTNLDVIKSGVNNALAKKLGLNGLEFISPSKNVETFHIAVYVPENKTEDVAEAVFKYGAGVIGNYNHCLNSYKVNGQFKPLSGSTSYMGEIDTLKKIEEIKLEFFTDNLNLHKVINAMLESHPYETPVYAVYPVRHSSQEYGLGLIGILDNPMELREFAYFVKKQLHCPDLRYWSGNKSDSFKIRRVAVCGGSGSSLINQIIGKADVFVSADFTYHTILDSPVPLIDAGHLYTEFPVLDYLKDMLRDFSLPVEIMPLNQHEINRLKTI